MARDTLECKVLPGPTKVVDSYWVRSWVGWGKVPSVVSKLLLCFQMGKLRYRGEAPQSVN